MITLSAFSDEISADLDEQIAVLEEEGIGYVELRSVWDTNILDLTDRQVDTIRTAFNRRHIRVSAIGSPLGKVPIDAPWEEQWERFLRTVDLAQRLGTTFIRLFSFYPPVGEADAQLVYHDAVIERLRAMADRAEAEQVVLLHENEKDIYGDSIARCVDLMTAVASPNFGAILDPANFIQCGETPYPEAYEAVKPWLKYIHVKDARRDGEVVVAGQGEARWPELLARLAGDGYRGFCSLEPHLASAGQYHGFSGPDLFRRASRAFQELLANSTTQ